jgi:RNA polymerase sigma-70 factor (ECF subfamily)
VVAAFMRFIKTERKLRRWDERHQEWSDLTDENLYKRAFCPPKSVEDATIDSQRNEGMMCAIQRLPEIQRRRFLLYFKFGLTYEQIAMMEGCSFQAVAATVKNAEIIVKKYLENWG